VLVHSDIFRYVTYQNVAWAQIEVRCPELVLRAYESCVASGIDGTKIELSGY